MSKILTALFLILTALPAGAQDFCDTVTDETFIARFDEIIAAHAREHRALLDTGIVHIPVVFHVEFKSSSPVVSDARLAQALDATNAWFRDAKTQFVKCGESMLFPTGTTPVLNRRTVNVALFRQSDGCGYASSSYVFINLNCNRTLENILSHELGHVMGLPHTHGYTNSGTTTELVDGSNCATDGDRFCDTPADPNLLGKVSGGCVYTGTARDANGMAYQPLTDNVMSYSNSQCADSLTPMQLARVRAVALASRYSCCTVAEPIVSDTAVCIGSFATLRAESPSVTLLWYDTPQGGAPVGSGRSFVTPPLVSTRAWYVEAVDTCVSFRARVVVQVNPPTGVIAGEMERLVRDLDSAATSSSPYGFLVMDSLLVLRTASAIWVSDGSSEGTRLLVHFPGQREYTITSMLPFGGRLLFGTNNSASGPSLWSADPASGAVIELVHLDRLDAFSNFWLTDAGSWVLFLLNDGSRDAEIWRSDGTSGGSTLVARLPGTSAFNDFDFTPFRGGVIFQAADSLHGEELWFSDGTAAGTRRIADLRPGAGGSSPGDFVISDGMIYYSADDSVSGRELWVTDGTSEGTRRITDINPGEASSRVGAITPLYGSLYFYAVDNGTNYEPYVSDGTPEGTRMLADIRPDNGSFPSDFTAFRDEVFCIASDGSGSELWALHPKGAAPPRRVRDIHPLGSSSISAMTVWNDLLYFAANDGRHGSELWRSDGTETGTFLLADIDTLTQQGASPSDPTPFRGGLYYSAFDKDHGREPRALSSSEFVVCSGSIAMLVAGNAQGEVRWYESEASPAPLASGRLWTTPPLERSRSYWADVTVDGCMSLRSAVPVRVRAPVPIVRDTAVAPGSDVEVEAQTESGEIEWYADSASSAATHSGPRLPLVRVQRDTMVYASSREDGCVSRRVPLHVRVGTTGIDAAAVLSDFTVFPNPVRDVLRIRLPRDSRAEEVIVCDMLGREVLRQAVTRQPVARSGGETLAVAVAGLSEGQYLAILREGGEQRSLRFIRLR